MERALEQRLRQAAACFTEARLVVLFGSVARGGAAPFSDADIGVLGLVFWRGLELGAELGAVLGREPHVVELDRTSDWLRYQVAREGLLLFEGVAGAWVCFQAEAALVWFDLEPLVARCAAAARGHLRGKQVAG